MKTKQCTKCKRNLEVTEFHKDSYHPTGFSSICKVCRKEKDANTYVKKRDYNLNRSKVWRLKSKQIVDNIKKEYGCFLCEETDQCCLDFHHLGTNKHDSVKEMLHHSISNLLLEISKCITLCANCHRKLHAGKLLLPDGIKPIDITGIQYE